MAANTLHGNNCGREGCWFLCRCAAKVILEQSGEVYPPEKGQSYCSNSERLVRFHFNFAYACDCSVSNIEQ